MKSLKVSTFGVLKKYGPLDIEVLHSCTADELKKQIAELLLEKYGDSFHPSLVENAALATGSRVLNSSDICEGTEFVLLPPVCGG